MKYAHVVGHARVMQERQLRREDKSAGEKAGGGGEPAAEAAATAGGCVVHGGKDEREGGGLQSLFPWKWKRRPRSLSLSLVGLSPYPESNFGGNNSITQRQRSRMQQEICRTSKQ